MLELQDFIRENYDSSKISKYLEIFSKEQICDNYNIKSPKLSKEELITKVLEKINKLKKPLEILEFRDFKERKALGSIKYERFEELIASLSNLESLEIEDSELEESQFSFENLKKSLIFPKNFVLQFKEFSISFPCNPNNLTLENYFSYIDEIIYLQKKELKYKHIPSEFAVFLIAKLKNLDENVNVSYKFVLQIYDSFFNELYGVFEESFVSYVFDDYKTLIKSLDNNIYKDFIENTEPL